MMFFIFVMAVNMESHECSLPLEVEAYLRGYFGQTTMSFKDVSNMGDVEAFQFGNEEYRRALSHDLVETFGFGIDVVDTDAKIDSDGKGLIIRLINKKDSSYGEEKSSYGKEDHTNRLKKCLKSLFETPHYPGDSFDSQIKEF